MAFTCSQYERVRVRIHADERRELALFLRRELDVARAALLQVRRRDRLRLAVELLHVVVFRREFAGDVVEGVLPRDPLGRLELRLEARGR